ncbi:hypothetical protein ACWENQ_44875 [Nonomuraea sp. NPDC004354]
MTITNPLGLPIEWRTSIEPYHEVRDTEKLSTLRADMETRGWHGPPIVCDRELAEVNQDRAYTGSHRIPAWTLAQDDPCASLPCVYLQDIGEQHGINFGELIDDAHGNVYAALEEFVRLLPTDIADAYGLDAG